MITELTKAEPLILAANAKDVELARANGSTDHIIDRLTINPKRMNDMREGLQQVIALPDPIGEVLTGYRRPNGLSITKVRVPIGVIGIIYESRPNVTVDAASLTVKTGNSVVLRGGKESINTNLALASALQNALASAGLPRDAISLIENTDRETAKRLMTLNGVIDCLIPRGGASLIQTVVRTSTVPVIETGAGNCHIYIDQAADTAKAVSITVNAKVQRPSVCNSAESLLVHKDVAESILPHLGEALRQNGVELRGDETVRSILPYSVVANDDDWAQEYNALVMSVKVVESVDEAVKWINTYSTHHSDAIITEDLAAAQYFLDGVDSAAVYVNASTRFTDGFEFGFGAEIGISNQKLHARGPMGLEELTTYKYLVRGDGQIRG
jgi:glutamate-5-semialdehyde dehydrogenase